MDDIFAILFAVLMMLALGFVLHTLNVSSPFENYKFQDGTVHYCRPKAQITSFLGDVTLECEDATYYNVVNYGVLK
jgi:hypothetical protein